MIPFATFLALALALEPAPQTTATPGPAASAEPMPAASAAAEPSASPASVEPPPATVAPAAATPAATALPTQSATASPYKYRFVPRNPANPQPGQPLITAVYLNDAHLRSKGSIAIKVETNGAVIKVVSRSNGREGLIPEVKPGDFEANSTLPKLPFIASGVTIELEFVATSADGRKTSVRVPVKLD